MSPDVTVAGLRLVREIALTGSFTAAARLLGYTQPTISRQVAAMEAAAGAPLFIREGRGVRVSPAGAVLVEHAGRILAGVQALRQDLAALDDRLAGRITLGAFPSATAVLVPPGVGAATCRSSTSGGERGGGAHAHAVAAAAGPTSGGGRDRGQRRAAGLRP